MEGQVSLTGFTGLLSDDPAIAGSDNPTETIIGSTPIFRVLKTSQDISGDANILQRGDSMSMRELPQVPPEVCNGCVFVRPSTHVPTVPQSTSKRH